MPCPALRWNLSACPIFRSAISMVDGSPWVRFSAFPSSLGVSSSSSMPHRVEKTRSLKSEPATTSLAPNEKSTVNSELTLEEQIDLQIRTSGPMSVATYMGLCLTHPSKGYYRVADPL